MRRYLLLLLLALFVGSACGQTEWTPAKSTRFVNDYAGVLDETRCNQLEHQLQTFSDSTSNQIVVVLTPSLYGDEAIFVAQRIGESWGVGQKDFSNGVVILLKTKSADEPWGDVAIATGYGVEAVLPDVVCGRIIDEKMMPHLAPSGGREIDYYSAIKAAVDVIMPVMKGEYSYADYQKTDVENDFWIDVLLIVFFGLVFYLLFRTKGSGGSSNNGGGQSGGAGMPWYGAYGSGGVSHRGGGSHGASFGGGSFGGGGASRRF